MTDTILIVDDEKDLLYGLERTVKLSIDCQVITAEDGETAMEILGQKAIDLVLADIRMPGMDGISLLEKIQAIDPTITVIIMTAYGSIQQAVEAIKSGAYDFIQKPFNEERLMHLLRKGLELNRLVRENERLTATMRAGKPFVGLVGQSRPMLTIFNTIDMLAKTDVTVLILGETGTGKELAAQAIHAKSDRAAKQMVTVNCPALPESILESELFGYHKGAFTNADRDKPGLFTEAEGSTIFLDEIGDLSSSVQTKLLRCLQDKKIQPLGGSQSIAVDARIIAATNQDLHLKMEQKQFREDLFYRLNVATLVMPPLRQITEDIPLLVDHFLKKIAHEQNITPKKLSPGVMNELMQREWPGNVRELENTIRGWCAVIPGEVIESRALHTDAEKPEPAVALDEFEKTYKELKEAAIESFTLDYLHRLLAYTQGNVSLSAQISGIKRQSLQKIIKRYHVPIDDYRNDA